MTYIVISLLLYACVFILDILPQIKKKNRKVVFIALPIFFSTLAVNVLYGLGVHIPSPAGPIKNFVSSIFGSSG